MDTSHLTRLKELEEENRRLKRMYADLALDHAIPKDTIEKTLEPEVKREIVVDTVNEYQVSIARGCRIIGIYRSLFYYATKKDDAEVEEAIRRESKFGDGFWKVFRRIRDAGYVWNYKSVYHVYKSIHFEKRSRLKKRLPARVRQHLVTPESPNITWSIDFVSDMLQCKP